LLSAAQLVTESATGGWRQETLLVFSPLHTPGRLRPKTAPLDTAISNFQFLRFRLAIENRKSTIVNLLVRYHAQDFVQVTVTHQSGMSQLLLPFVRLRSQHMAQLCMSALHFPLRSFLEALGSALV
jgi:hypothetical protein